MKRLILYLIRRRLGLKKYQPFRFAGQKDPFNFYFFDEFGIEKYVAKHDYVCQSSVSLNWLLNDKCCIVPCEDL